MRRALESPLTVACITCTKSYWPSNMRSKSCSTIRVSGTYFSRNNERWLEVCLIWLILLWNELVCSFKLWNIIHLSKNFILCLPARKARILLPTNVASKIFLNVSFLSESQTKLVYSHVLSLMYLNLNLFCVIIKFYRSYTLFPQMEQKWNFHIFSILWKCQQGRCPSRINISPNKSLGTPV